MLREQARFLRSVLIAADTVILAAAAVAAYVVRFDVFAALDIWPPQEPVKMFKLCDHSAVVVADQTQQTVVTADHTAEYEHACE